MLIRIVGPVEGVSPAAGRGAATSTSRLCLRSTAMLSVDDQTLVPSASPVRRHPRPGKVMHHTVMCDASWLSLVAMLPMHT